MNKIIKIISILSLNIIILLSLLVCSDFIIFNIQNKKVHITDKFTYLTKDVVVFGKNALESDFFNEKDDSTGLRGRLPVGLQYAHPPIIVFGCSYAYGQFLKYNQTFSYKLSELLKVPVYNRALAGGGLQAMYMQVNSDSFYKEVPDFDTCLYIFWEDHYRRMMGESFFINDLYFYPYFKYDKGDLIYDERNNPI